MGNEKAALGLVMVCILLIASYNYVIGEVQAAATADPTHAGKAFMAEVMPILYAVICFGAVAATGYVIFDVLK